MPNAIDIKNNAPADLFSTNSKGEWYFYNTSLRARGQNDFKSKWGVRANLDNWRRKADLDLLAKNAGVLPVGGGNIDVPANASTQSLDISYETLMGNLPLSPEKTDSSNSIVASNLFALAKLYQNELEDYEEAIKTYEECLRRFPNKLEDGDIYLGLYYCYNKTGNTERANYYKNLLNSQFANTKSWQKLNNPAAVNTKTQNPAATKTYEHIYDLFIEGNFDEALAEKKKADSSYGKNYWTPQLLYIEALYNVRQHNDSIAIIGLNAIIDNNPASPLKQKAATMIDVLKRRKEIETYLTNLQVTRAQEDVVIMQDENNKPVAKQQPAPVIAPVIKKPSVVMPVIKDTMPLAQPQLTAAGFVIKPDAKHVVLMIMEKVDGVYVNEAKNAFTRYNKENYYSKFYEIAKDALDAERSMLTIGSFTDDAEAIQYYDKIKKDAAREVSWLPANKYYFLIITNENLQVLKTNKDLAGYKALLNKQYPGKF
jgi:tetratricopeptide (TPR) repeat protein